MPWLFLLLGCPSSVRTWPALDLPALEQRLDNPTTPISALGEHVEDLLARIVLARSFEALQRDSLQSLFAGSDTDSSYADEEVRSGTRVFVEVACPGEGDGPDPDYQHGTVTIDSPLLLEPDFTPLVGPLLLQLDDCGVDATTLAGEVRARWVAEEQRLWASGELTLDQGTLLPIDLELSAERVRFRAPLVGGFVTLELGPGEVAVNFADGRAVCGTTGCEAT